MQIFTPEMLMEMYYQSRALRQAFFDSILNAAWENIVAQYGQLTQAIYHHEWSGVLFSTLFILSGVFILYRLFRGGLFRIVRLLIDSR